MESISHINTDAPRFFYPDIEGLRGLAVIGVLLHHLYIYFPGWVGVNLFFVISGFVVTRSLEGIMQNRLALHTWKEKWGVLKIFYLRRFFRIVPLAIVWVMLYIAFSTLAPNHSRVGNPAEALREFYYMATLQLNYRFVTREVHGIFSHFWSLNVEEQFYLLLPILWLACLRWRNRFWIVTLEIALVCFLIRPHFYDLESRYVSYLLHTQADNLLFGVLLSLSLPKSREVKKVALGGRVFFSILSIFLIAGILVTPLIFPGPSLPTLGYPIVGILSSVLTVLAISQKALLFLPRAAYRGLGWIGKHSYAIYIVHYGVIQFYDEWVNFWGFTPTLVGRFLFHNLGRTFTFAAISFVLAFLLNKFIETPFIKLRKRFQLANR